MWYDTLETCELMQANAGDSRTVLGRKGYAVELSNVHKPSDKSTLPHHAANL